jgi:hypothetical protein
VVIISCNLTGSWEHYKVLSAGTAVSDEVRLIGNGDHPGPATGKGKNFQASYAIRIDPVSFSTDWIFERASFVSFL